MRFDSPPAGSLPKWLAGARSFVWVSHVGAGAKHLDCALLLLGHMSRKVGWKGAAGTQTGARMGWGCQQGRQ